MMAPLHGQKVELVFPVTLSAEARREALVETGVRPLVAQWFELEHLLQIDDLELRRRVVDLLERTTRHPPKDDDTVWDPEIIQFDRLVWKDGGWRSRTTSLTTARSSPRQSRSTGSSLRAVGGR